MGEERRSTPNVVSIVVLVAILLLIAVVGFLIVDTINQVRAPARQTNEALGTAVQQVFNPTPTIIADPITIVRSVQDLSRLETAAFTVEKVITAETGDETFGFLFRDRLLLVAVGQVIAGVDLSRFSEEDVSVAGEAVFVTMPAAEIFVATLDNDATYVYDRDTAILAPQNINLETLARQEAENQILLGALENGILDMAQDNAEVYLQGLLEALGFEEVNFVRGTPAPDQNIGP